MPVTHGAKKKVRADTRKRTYNLRVKARLRKTVKEFQKSPSKPTLVNVYSVLDSAAKKNVIPKKRAARKKSRLAWLLKPKTSAKSVTSKSGKTRKTSS